MSTGAEMITEDTQLQRIHIACVALKCISLRIFVYEDGFLYVVLNVLELTYIDQASLQLRDLLCSDC